MRIVCDLDGVVQDFQQRWADLYYTWYGRKVESLDAWDSLITETHFESGKEFFAWFDRAGGWEDLALIPGAMGGLETILDHGHNVVFATARHTPTAIRATELWHARSPFNKQVVLRTNMQQKWTIPAGLWIDDSPDNVADLVEHGKQVIVFDQPWNQDVEEGELVTRAHDWDEVVTAVVL